MMRKRCNRISSVDIGAFTACRQTRLCPMKNSIQLSLATAKEIQIKRSGHHRPQKIHNTHLEENFENGEEKGQEI